jgi:hypothetical protein
MTTVIAGRQPCAQALIVYGIRWRLGYENQLSAQLLTGFILGRSASTPWMGESSVLSESQSSHGRGNGRPANMASSGNRYGPIQWPVIERDGA